MPVSKRNRVISLTQTKKKGLQHKEKLVNDVREAVEKFNSVFIFSIENMRNNKMKDVREEWKGTSKLIMGKNKVLQLALGRNAENEIADNIHKVSERLLGQCGLLLTSQPESEVVEWFENFREPEFARAGFVATETVVFKDNDLNEFSHTMEPQFRRLGLPTKLVNGKIQLLNEFTVCNEGDTLSPEMADVLKLKGIQMADFHVTLEFVWHKGGSFKVLHEKDERSLAEVKKAKAKRSKTKRAKMSIGTTEKDEDDQNDQEDNAEDSEDSDEEDVEMQDDVEEEVPEVKESPKKQKENRPVKKAVRKHAIKHSAKDDDAVETKAPPASSKRVTRSSMKHASK